MTRYSAMRKRTEAVRYSLTCRFCGNKHPIRLCPVFRATAPRSLTTHYYISTTQPKSARLVNRTPTSSHLAANTTTTSAKPSAPTWESGIECIPPPNEKRFPKWASNESTKSNIRASMLDASGTNRGSEDRGRRAPPLDPRTYRPVRYDLFDCVGPRAGTPLGCNGSHQPTRLLP
ncbi:uncharacterized protein LOC118749373 [Rhagoletis pomonella]|uniref:uncharacterized protein LOC118749373 n=1 Tax=Rhagoletis pomonella TaxID=28610 RepID=UPI001783EDCE|nr:uncharacterized protein LOC118749373 [Rhagoletis pomonella]